MHTKRMLVFWNLTNVAISTIVVVPFACHWISAETILIYRSNTGVKVFPWCSVSVDPAPAENTADSYVGQTNPVIQVTSKTTSTDANRKQVIISL
jgi:hypothetical protein